MQDTLAFFVLCALGAAGCGDEGEDLDGVDIETTTDVRVDDGAEVTLDAVDAVDASEDSAEDASEDSADADTAPPPTCADVTFDPVAPNPWDSESSLAPCECYGCENPGSPYPPCPEDERCDAGIYPYVSTDYARYQAAPATHGLCRHMCRDYTSASDAYPYCNESALRTQHDCPETESCERFDSYFSNFEMPFEESYGLCAKAP